MEELSDYKDKPKELIGRYVLIENRDSSYLKKVEKVNKETFRAGNYTFYFNGRERTSSIWNSYSAILKTNEEAQTISKQWADAKEKRKLIEIIKSQIDKESLETVKKIHELLTP